MFAVEIIQGSPRRLVVRGPEGPRAFSLEGQTQADYQALFAAVAAAFGTRRPLAADPAHRPAGRAAYRPLLTEPMGPRAPYGYGDPSVTFLAGGEGRAGEWRLFVTSNDSPDAFPILRSADLEQWEPAGFVFPEGATPDWALAGEDGGDFWAPEMHVIDGACWLCFAARQKSGELAIGLARADRPDGPYRAQPQPLVAGGAIDPHLVLVPDGGPHLVWKEDANDLWPLRLAALMQDRPGLSEAIFRADEDRRSAALAAAMSPWTAGLAPMERFFALQPLIEAATADFAGVRLRLAAAAARDPTVAGPVAGILAAMTTAIFVQPLDPATMTLIGERRRLLENDQAWEAHLVEGPWITSHGGRFWLFYAGNDFSTQHYGVGVAVADHPLGPYEKLADRVLVSTVDWWGPGHPSVAPGLDGTPQLFFHAFRPGETGYKAFRALLTAPIRFDGDRVQVG